MKWASDPGLQPQRTSLAWHRTAQLAALCGLLQFRVGLQELDTGQLAAAIAFGLTALVLAVFARRRHGCLTRGQPLGPRYWVPATAALSIVVCAAAELAVLQRWMGP